MPKKQQKCVRYTLCLHVCLNLFMTKLITALLEYNSQQLASRILMRNNCIFAYVCGHSASLHTTALPQNFTIYRWRGTQIDSTTCGTPPCYYIPPLSRYNGNALSPKSHLFSSTFLEVFYNYFKLKWSCLVIPLLLLHTSVANSTP